MTAAAAVQAPDAPAVQLPLDLQQVQQFWMSLPEGHRKQLLQMDCDEALERAGDPMAASESGASHVWLLSSSLWGALCVL